MGRKNETKAAKAGKTKAAGIPLSRDGKRIAELRADGKTWDEIGTLVSGDASRPASAIPLRVVLRRYLAENEDANAAIAKARNGSALVPLAPTPAAIVAARDGAGEGFPLIAARTGLSVADVRSQYRAGGGENANGRIYVGAAGRTLVLPGGERVSLPAFDPAVAASRALAGSDEPSKAERKAAKRARKAAKAAKAERKAAKAAKRAKAA